MSSPVVPVDVLVAVPPGTRRPEPLLEALAEQHADWNAQPVWAGDPQLRPRLSGRWSWREVGLDEADLLRVDDDALPWLLALTALAERPIERPTVVLVAGTAVLGPIDELVPTGEQLVVVPRSLSPVMHTGSHPTVADFAESGSVSSSVAAFGVGADDAIGWLRLAALVPTRLEHAVRMGRLLELATEFFPSRTCADDRIGASIWRWPDRAPHLIDLPNFDVERRWLADPELDGTPRVSLAAPERLAAIDAAADQLAGSTEPLRLPGGVPVDKVIRRIARHHPELPARPWSDAAAFRRWLDAQYWADLHWARGDLQGIFPYRTGLDADRFAAWARRAAADGDAPLMIDPSVLRSTAAIERTGERTDGVNLVGYFKHQSGISTVGRHVAEILGRHGVPHTTVAYERTWSPSIVPEPATDQRLDFAATIAFVNGDQFGHLASDVPALFGPGRTVAGMWFWELDTIEGAPPVGHAHADQIWGMTRFTADPFRHLGVPVHRVWVPVAEPRSSGRRRHEFEPLAAVGERFVFGVVLDHLSITERKNPLAAIRAFKQAFPLGAVGGDPDGPVLVVKTINAAVGWDQHERLLVEAAGRPDIVVWDELLPLADHLALIASFDALVSLHRSEGAGLHLAEAMWLERPVIATNYSGNLDFMDEASAILVDADLVPVGPGLFPYPPSAKWAEPRLDDAVAAMQRLAADPERAAALGRAGRAKIASMPGETEFVDRITDLLGLDVHPRP